MYNKLKNYMYEPSKDALLKKAINFTSNSEYNLEFFWILIANLGQLSKLIQVEIMGKKNSEVENGSKSKIEFMKKMYNLYKAGEFTPTKNYGNNEKYSKAKNLGKDLSFINEINRNRKNKS